MKIFKNKWIKWVLIPSLLTLLWVGLSVSYVNKSPGLNVLQYDYQQNDIKSFKEGELLIGDRVKAEFISHAGNLGIVAVRFNTYVRINNDILNFRIKEKGQDKWFYTNTYHVNQFQPNQLFTFGFPIIADSEGRIYQFELESTKGKPEDAVAISPMEPVFVARHEYTRSSIINNTDTLLYFVNKKITNLLINPDFILSSLTYLLPLVFYLSYITYFGKNPDLKNNLNNGTDFISIIKSQPDKYRIVLLPLSFILLNTFLVSSASHAVIILLMMTWIFILKAFKLDSRTSFSMAVLLLALCIPLLILKQDDITEKMALWAYMFLLVGTLHQIFELRGENQTKKVGSNS